MNTLTLRQNARAFLLDEFAASVDTLLAHVSRGECDIAVTENAVEELVRRVRQIAVDKALEVQHACVDTYYVCPQCHEPLGSWQSLPRQVVTTQGAVRLQTKRYRCGVCQQDFYPFVEANGLQNNAFTFGAKHLIAEIAAQRAYALSARDAHRAGIPVSASHSDHIAQEVGAWRQEEEQEVIAAHFNLQENVPKESVPALASEKDWPAQAAVLVSVDGGMVRSPEMGAEGCVWFEARAGVIAPILDGDQVSGHKIVLGGVHDADAIFEKLKSVYWQAMGSGRRCVFGGDGADWIWQRVGLYFPQAIQVLDIYHGGEHVTSAMAARFGLGDARTAYWRSHVRGELLKEGAIGRIVRDLEGALASPQTLADAQELGKELAYLKTHQHRMNYFWLEQEGLPVGSGSVESTIKQLCVGRLRQSGMKWTRVHASAMLSLRAAVLSGELGNTVDRRRQKQLARMESFRPQPLKRAA
jgi:uncharacterized CHY-type Zn-finger protein